MILLNTLLTFLLSLIFISQAQFKLNQDIQKDVQRLQENHRYFISDNTSETASLKDIQSDLQLFGLISNLNLNDATYSQRKEGPHLIHQWKFDEGEIYSITQIESNIHLDSVITQRYLEDRPPSQHRMINDFIFRTYQITTISEPAKFLYITEADQGLLAYKFGKKQIDISYTAAKTGLNDLFPKYRKEVESLLKDYSTPAK
jgi:hypothetical protein